MVNFHGIAGYQRFLGSSPIFNCQISADSLSTSDQQDGFLDILVLQTAPGKLYRTPKPSLAAPMTVLKKHQCLLPLCGFFARAHGSTAGDDIPQCSAVEILRITATPKEHEMTFRKTTSKSECQSSGNSEELVSRSMLQIHQQK